MYLLANNNKNAKIAGAKQSKTPGRSSGNLGRASSKNTISNDGAAVDLFSNLMEPNRPFLLPRLVPTSAAPYYLSPVLPYNQNTQDNPYGGIIVSPDPKKFVTIVKYETSEVVPEYVTVPHSPVSSPNINHNICLGPLFQTTAGNVLKPDIVPMQGMCFVGEDGDWIDQYAPIYRGVTLTSASIAIKALVQPNSWAATFKLKDATGCTTQNQINSAPTLATFFNSAIAPNVWTTDAVTPIDCVNKDLCLVSNVATSDVLQFQIQVMGMTTTPQWIHQEYSLFELLANVGGSETLEEQFNRSQSFCITAVSVRGTVTTAPMYKSGGLASAQFTGRSKSFLPNTADKMYKYIGAYNDPKVHEGELSKGVHWFFVPEKIQDWFYKPTDVVYEDNMPYFAAAWYAPPVGDATQIGITWYFDVTYELLTTDISAMKFSPSADTHGLMQLYLTLVSSHNPLSENPNHKAKIKQIVTAITKDPAMRKLLSETAKAGKRLLPLAMTAGSALLSL